MGIFDGLKKEKKIRKAKAPVSVQEDAEPITLKLSREELTAFVKASMADPIE